MLNQKYHNPIIVREKQTNLTIKVVCFLNRVVFSMNLFLRNVLNKNKDFTQFIANLEKLYLTNGPITADCHMNTKKIK
jgi:hypothetical protein